MNKKPRTKKIKILSKGIVTTSRGRCRTPIATPYSENIDTILSMLSRDKAKIVEVLPSGKEIELTIYNFSQDNTGETTPKTPIKVEHVAVPEVVNAGTNQPIPERQLSRKERRELERQARAKAEAEADAKQEDQKVEPIVENSTAKTPTTEDTPADPATIEESSAIVEDAIDE